MKREKSGMGKSEGAVKRIDWRRYGLEGLGSSLVANATSRVLLPVAVCLITFASALSGTGDDKIPNYVPGNSFNSTTTAPGPGLWIRVSSWITAN